MNDDINELKQRILMLEKNVQDLYIHCMTLYKASSLLLMYIKNPGSLTEILKDISLQSLFDEPLKSLNFNIDEEELNKRLKDVEDNLGDK